MPRPRKSSSTDSASADLALDYRYPDAKRKNIPPAGLAAQGSIRKEKKHTYTYNPHLPPVLRFDNTGRADALPDLLRTATERALSKEAGPLADASPSHHVR